MGHVNAPMVLGTLGAIELGLAALKVPHGRGGLQAAIDHLAAAIA
jgi:alanine-glyoxylate transaminase/serine-glyoxylate transaminase/serine-pyruvate transaminase